MDYVISVVVRTPEYSYPFLHICKKTARNIKDEGYFIYIDWLFDFIPSLLIANFFQFTGNFPRNTQSFPSVLSFWVKMKRRNKKIF